MSSENGKILNFIAFVALIAVALLQVLEVLKPILSFDGLVINLINTIKNFCICLVVGITAYKFVANKSKGLKISYWVSIIIFVVGTVLIWIV